MKGLLIANYFLTHISLFLYIAIASIVAFVLLIFTSYEALPFSILIILLLSSLPSLEIIKKENNSSFDKYVLTLPITRKMIVKGHYIFYFLTSLIGLVASYIVYTTYILLDSANLNSAFIESASIGIFIVLFGGALVFPLLYIFGSEKSDAIVISGGMLGLVAVFLLQIIISQFQYFLNFEDLSNIVPLIYIFSGLVIYVMSYYISSYIYKRKDF